MAGMTWEQQQQIVKMGLNPEQRQQAYQQMTSPQPESPMAFPRQQARQQSYAQPSQAWQQPQPQPWAQQEAARQPLIPPKPTPKSAAAPPRPQATQPQQRQPLIPPKQPAQQPAPKATPGTYAATQEYHATPAGATERQRTEAQRNASITASSQYQAQQRQQAASKPAPRPAEPPQRTEATTDPRANPATGRIDPMRQFTASNPPPPGGGYTRGPERGVLGDPNYNDRSLPMNGTRLPSGMNTGGGSGAVPRDTQMRGQQQPGPVQTSYAQTPQRPPPSAARPKVQQLPPQRPPLIPPAQDPRSNPMQGYGGMNDFQMPFDSTGNADLDRQMQDEMGVGGIQYATAPGRSAGPQQSQPGGYSSYGTQAAQPQPMSGGSSSWQPPRGPYTTTPPPPAPSSVEDRYNGWSGHGANPADFGGGGIQYATMGEQRQPRGVVDMPNYGPPVRASQQRPPLIPPKPRR